MRLRDQGVLAKAATEEPLRELEENLLLRLFSGGRAGSDHADAAGAPGHVLPEPTEQGCHLRAEDPREQVDLVDDQVRGSPMLEELFVLAAEQEILEHRVVR